MITDILYRCPSCGSFEWMDGSGCVHCRAAVQVVSRTEVSINGERNTISHWYRRVLSFELPPGDTGPIMQSGRVVLSREAAGGTYRGFAGVIAARFTRAVCDEGVITLKGDGLRFSGDMEALDIPMEDLIALTIESNTIILTSSTSGILFFDFIHESGKKWEDCIRRCLERFHASRKITEFYPRLRFEDDFREKPARARGHQGLRVPINRHYRLDASLLLPVIRVIARPVIKSLFSVDIKGLEHIPEQGPAVLLSNHTSFMDSLILGAFPRRNIWFMAKNSEYRGRLLTWALRHARSFPVRRYTIDAQAVRNAVRVINQGHILGIYPEGERTWDNSLLPFRSGTIRLVLALGKPVIPVGISGAYELMPRWTSSIRRSPVRIRIGPPLMFDHIPVPQQTRADIMEAERVLRTHIHHLSGENH
ncbi:MAG: 1-acyl-sn-glycerol-3-phosphate acyltransferase [Desulfomonilia bacterium]